MALSKAKGGNDADCIVGERECTLDAAHAKLMCSEEAERHSKVDVRAIEKGEAILVLFLKHATSRAGESLAMGEATLALSLANALIVASRESKHGHQQVSGHLGGGEITKERDLVHDRAERVNLGEEDADEISLALRCNIVYGEETFETRADGAQRLGAGLGAAGVGTNAARDVAATWGGGVCGTAVCWCQAFSGAKSSTRVSARAESGTGLATFISETSSGENHLAVGIRVAASATGEVTVGTRKTTIAATLGLVASNTSLLETLALAASGSVDGGAVGRDGGGADDGLLRLTGWDRCWRCEGGW